LTSIPITVRKLSNLFGLAPSN